MFERAQLQKDFVESTTRGTHFLWVFWKRTVWISKTLQTHDQACSCVLSLLGWYSELLERCASDSVDAYPEEVTLTYHLWPR